MLREKNQRPVPTEKVGDLQPGFLLRLLDEIDYGLVLISAQGAIQHANHLARHELATGRLLHADASGFLTGRVALLTEQLMSAVHGAALDRRRLVYLTHGEHTLPVAVIPIAHARAESGGRVLLVMARQRLGDNLVLQMFAREHCLTPTEELVLRALCNGREVGEIARQHGVAESTVRTQVRSLRDKTGANGIRQLVHRVLSLPPVVPALRSDPCQPRRAGSANA